MDNTQLTDKEILEKFGKELMEHCRDSALEVFHATLEGKMKSPDCVNLYQRSLNFSDENKTILKDFVYSFIDNTIHHFLWELEDNYEFDLIYYKDKEKNPKDFVSLPEISDGLCGEPLTEDGWIEKYSKYPPSDSSK